MGEITPGPGVSLFSRYTQRQKEIPGARQLLGADQGREPPANSLLKITALSFQENKLLPSNRFMELSLDAISTGNNKYTGGCPPPFSLAGLAVADVWPFPLLPALPVVPVDEPLVLPTETGVAPLF